MLYQQPQGGPYEIDWSNPITRGLVFCVPGVPGFYDDVAGKRKATLSAGIGKQSNANGLFGLLAGQYLDYPAFGPELPSTGPATIAFIDQAVSPGTYSSTIDFIPYGGANEVLIYQSVSDTTYNFSAGIRGATTPKFSGVGQALAGINRRMLVRTNALSSTTIADWTAFVGQAKYPADSTIPLSGGTSVGHRWGARDGGSDPWKGALGQMLIWNRALTDAEALSYNANPSQIFVDHDEDEAETLYVQTASGTTIAPGTGTLALTGSAPTITQPRTVSPGTGSLTFTGYAPSVTQSTAVTLAPGTVALAFTGYAPLLSQGRNIFPGSASLSLSGPAPTVAQARNLFPGAATLALTGYAPTVQQTTPVTLSPGTASFTLTGYAPVILFGLAVIPAYSINTAMRVSTTNIAVASVASAYGVNSGTMRSSNSLNGTMRAIPINLTATMRATVTNLTVGFP